MDTRSKKLILAYLVDLTGETSTEYIETIIQEGLQKETFQKYNTSTESFVDTPESFLFDLGMSYYLRNRRLIPLAGIFSHLERFGIVGDKVVGYQKVLAEAQTERLNESGLKHHIQEMKNYYLYWQYVHTFFTSEDAVKKAPNTAIQTVINRLHNLTANCNGSQTTFSLRGAAQERIDRHLRFAATQAMHGFYTGIVPLDKEMRGLLPGELLVIVGRTSIGKSLVLQHVAKHGAMNEGANVIFASAEVGWNKEFNTVADRLEAMAIGFYSANQLRWGNIPQTYWDNLKGWYTSFSEMKGDIHLVPPTRCGTTMQLQAECRMLARDRKIDLLVVDYIQPITAGITPRWADKQQVAYELQMLGAELECPVISASQESRTGYQAGENADAGLVMAESEGIARTADDVVRISRDKMDGDRIIFQVMKCRNGKAGYSFSTRCNWDIPMLGGVWMNEMSESYLRERRLHDAATTS